MLTSAAPLWLKLASHPCATHLTRDRFNDNVSPTQVYTDKNTLDTKQGLWRLFKVFFKSIFRFIHLLKKHLQSPCQVFFCLCE